jgi:DNA-directed RNA polymerase specialized sigma24 family protein
MQTSASDNLPGTLWTLVGDAGSGLPDALARLLTLYRRAMVTHLVIRQNWQPADAEDIVHNFVMDKILTQNFVAAANRKAGRFRNFLLTSLDNYARERRRAAAAQKRRPDAASRFDEDFDAPVRGAPADPFHIEWARDLVACCVQRMEAECAASNRRRIFEVFRGRLLEPAVRGATPLPYGEMVERFGFGDPMQAANALITAKRMFERHLRAAIREYAATEEEVEQEIKELFDALSQSR